MKKIVKLNEEDIERMVGRIINEESNDINTIEDVMGWLNPGDSYRIGRDYSDRHGVSNIYTYVGERKTGGREIADFRQLVNGKIEKSYQNPKTLLDYYRRNQLTKEDPKINEDHTLPRRERERHANQFAKSKFEPYDREREIMDAFGPYRDDVPANVVSYLRKNPKRFLQKLVKVYGMDKTLEYIGYEGGENIDLDYNN